MKNAKENDVMMIKQQPKTNSVRMFDGDKALMDQFMKDEKKTQHILIHELLAEHKHKLFVEGHPDFQNEIEEFNKVNECAASMFLSLVNRYGNQSNVIRNEFQNELKANAQTINSLHTQISELTNKIKIMEDESLKTKNQLSNQIEVKDNLKSQNETLKKRMRFSNEKLEIKPRSSRCMNPSTKNMWHSLISYKNKMQKFKNIKFK